MVTKSTIKTTKNITKSKVSKEKSQIDTSSIKIKTKKIADINFIRSPCSKGLESFKRLLKESMTKGWQPFGSIFVLDTTVEKMLVQQVIKYED